MEDFPTLRGARTPRGRTLATTLVDVVVHKLGRPRARRGRGRRDPRTTAAAATTTNARLHAAPTFTRHTHSQLSLVRELPSAAARSPVRAVRLRPFATRFAPSISVNVRSCAGALLLGSHRTARSGSTALMAAVASATLPPRACPTTTVHVPHRPTVSARNPIARSDAIPDCYLMCGRRSRTPHHAPVVAPARRALPRHTTSPHPPASTATAPIPHPTNLPPLASGARRDRQRRPACATAWSLSGRRTRRARRRGWRGGARSRRGGC